jgi:hypothetical protein
MAPDSPDPGRADKARLHVLIDADLYEELKKQSSKLGVTVTDIVTSLIRQYLSSPQESGEGKYKELLDRVGVYVPPPGVSDETVLNWLSYRIPSVIYNVCVTMYEMGNEYRDHAFRIASLCKKHYPSKWMHVMDLFRAYRPDLVEVFGIKHSEREVLVQ